MSGQEVYRRSHRPRVNPEKLAELSSSRERLRNGKIEVRFVDLERDGEKLAELFNQPTTTKHLSGIAPEETPPDIDVKKYGKKFPEYGVLVANKADLKEYYEERPNLKLLVAEDNNKGVVGTVTVESPGGLGLTYAGVSRLAVDENERRRGIGKKLLRAASGLIFTSRDAGGLGCFGAQAGVILTEKYDVIFSMPQTGANLTEDALGEILEAFGLEYDSRRFIYIPRVGIIRPGEGIVSVLRLFDSEGYENRHLASRNCVSWDRKLGRFVERDTVNLGVKLRDVPRGWSRYFPQPKPS